MPGFLAGLLVFWTVLAHGAQRKSLHEPASAKLAGLAPAGHLPPTTRLNLSLGLPLRNEQALTNLLRDLYDPASPRFHQYLSPDEFAAAFGPAESEYQALIAHLESNGLTVVHRHPNRLVLDVNGVVSDIERVFSTRLNLYQHPRESRLFYAPETTPSIESTLSVVDVNGLDNFLIPHPSSLRARASAAGNAGSAPGGTYRGNDFRAAYAPGVALSGAGQVVGLLEFDGYYAADITAYEAQAGLPNVPLQKVLLNGFSGAPGADNDEVALDIEVAIAVAPGLSSVMIYEGTTADSILSRMATDNRAKQLSSSWTFGIDSTTENIFRQFASQGQSMFQASGDNGAYADAIDTPADDPNVTVVGGTMLSTAGPGGAWTGESAWNWASSGQGTNSSGGGISTTYLIPTYQKGINMTANQGSTVLRNIPDVAMAADKIWVTYNNGSKGAFGGTSASTPLFAAFTALVNQQSVANGKGTVGFVNPALYAIGTSSNYAVCFHDIRIGNNTNASSPTKFPAVPGYDLCTGWGTPAGQPLINALAGGTNLPPVFTSDPFAVPQATVGQPITGAISQAATDPNSGERLTFAKLSGPVWLSVAPGGSLSGTPDSTNIGTNIFRVSVSEPAGMSNTATMYVPVVMPQPVSLQITPQPPNGLVLSWSGASIPMQVQLSTNLVSGLWVNFGSSGLTGSVILPSSGPVAFYRLVPAGP